MTSPQVPFFLERQAPENFEWRHPGERTADFYVSYTRHGLHRRFSTRPVILEVRRQDQTMNITRDLRRHP